VIIKIAIKRAGSRAHTLSVEKRKSIVALAFSIDIGLIKRADRLTETTN
jgi:hypothetical protein